MGEIFVVHMDLNSSAQQNGMKFLKSFDNREKLFFDCCIVTLGGVEFARIVSDWTALLFDNRAKLIFTGIRFNIERQGVVRKNQESIRSDESFHMLKSLLMDQSPDKGLLPVSSVRGAKTWVQYGHMSQ